MAEQIGIIKSLFRYPVKSMAAIRLESVEMGLNGLRGDRRFAFIRNGDSSDFPWLNASKLSSLISYQPVEPQIGDQHAVPQFVITPHGESLELAGERLQSELSAAHGTDVRLVHFKNGIF